MVKLTRAAWLLLGLIGRWIDYLFGSIALMVINYAFVMHDLTRNTEYFHTFICIADRRNHS